MVTFSLRKRQYCVEIFDPKNHWTLWTFKFVRESFWESCRLANSEVPNSDGCSLVQKRGYPVNQGQPACGSTLQYGVKAWAFLNLKRGKCLLSLSSCRKRNKCPAVTRKFESPICILDLANHVLLYINSECFQHWRGQFLYQEPERVWELL